MKEVADDRIFKKDEIERVAREEDEAICQWIRKVLYKKPEIAGTFIATKYSDMTIREYAASIAKPGDDIVKLKTTCQRSWRGLQRHLRKHIQTGTSKNRMGMAVGTV